MSDLLVERLARTAQCYRERPAVISAKGVLTYDELWTRARVLAASIVAHGDEAPFIGVLANRGADAYIGLLAALIAGKGYVPLSPKQPTPRLAKVIEAGGVTTVLYGDKCQATLQTLLDNGAAVTAQASLAAPGSTAATDSFGASTTLKAPSDANATDIAAVTPADFAYLLFTSGSTGAPKGISVTHANLAAYLDAVTDLYGYGPDDRHAQTFELSFDLSVHDLMVAWTTGGALVPIVGAGLLAAGRLIQKFEITRWFSVPSTAIFMADRGGLRDGAYPSLRTSLFCGEAFPDRIARAWSLAAPNSTVHNLYGPTEATIAFTHHQWASTDEARRGVVPIGAAFAGQTTALVDGANRRVDGEGVGELLLAGSQVTPGYWQAPEQTSERFCVFPWAPERWYRTGDTVERDASGVLHFVGRQDNQIKFRGYRIELADIEAALRTAAGTDHVVALAWPHNDAGVQGITALTAGAPRDTTEIMRELRTALPDYMLPREVVQLDEFPLSPSGKVDRNALEALLVARSDA